MVYQYHKILGNGRGFWKSGRQVSWAITFMCDLAFVLFGIEQGIIGNLIDGDDFLETFGNPTGSYLGIIVSVYTLGCFFGCILNYFTGDILGRRLTIIWAMILIIIGVVLQASAFSVPHFMIGRFIAGLGTGLETSCVPMYQAELSRPEIRGNLVCSEPLFVGVGLIYAYWLTYGISYVGGSIIWRLPIATQIIFAVVVLGVTFTLPESPRYLYMENDKEDAKLNLSYVFGREDDHPEIVALYSEIEDAMLLETHEGEYNWKRLVKNDKAKTRHRIILSYMSMFAQQVGGINLINYYITTALINNVGLEKNLAMILAGCSVICFTIGSLVPSFFSDKLGRRMPLVLGHTGGGFSMLMIAILLSFQNSSFSKQTSSAAVAFFFTFQLVFGASANCIPWVLVPELLPLHARSKGTAIGISANWLWNFVVVEITPVIISDIKWASYLIFAITNFCFAVMFFFCYPETKALTLEAIDKVFVENNRFCMGFVNTRKYVGLKDISDLENGTPLASLSKQESSSSPFDSSKQDVQYIEKADSSIQY